MNNTSEIQFIKNYDPDYPPFLKTCLANKAPAYISSMGNINLLKNKPLAVFSSSKCPEKVILQTYDLMKNIREARITVISGFHSPIERECMNILLRDKQPLILCPARSIEGMRLRGEYKQPIADGRLLLLSPFDEKQRRPTVPMALYRNQFMAALADEIFVAHAEPNSKTKQFCREVLAWQKPLYTLKSDANANIIALGAKPVSPDNLSEWT